MDAGRRRVAVVRVEQQAVRQRLEPAGEPVEACCHLRRHLLGRALGAEAELYDLTCRVTADELLRRALGGDLALVHDDEPVAELFRLVHVVRRQDQRHAALLEPEEAVPDRVARLRVEPVVGSSSSSTSGSFTSERAIVRRRFMPPDRGSTLSSARSLELDELEQLVGALAELGARQAEVTAVDDDVLAHGQLHVERVLLRDDAQACADARRPR